LSQVCTFPRKHYLDNQHFVEEYVVPQLLTEAVRLHKYDGILYPSTRFINKKLDLGNGWRNMLFKTNIAMFTTYSSRFLYDKDLLKNVIPHVIDLSKVNETDARKELDELKKGIDGIEKFLNEKTHNTPIKEKFFAQLIHLEKKIKTYLVLSIEGKPYLDYYIGKAEVAYMKEYFSYVVSLIRRVYEKEYEEAYYSEKTNSQ
jgi:hypothetical protein